MSLSDYLIGVLLIAWVWGGSLLVGILVVRAVAGGLTGSARATAVGIVASSTLIVVHVVPGMLTILTAPAVAITVGVAIAAATILERRRHGVFADREPPRLAPPSSVAGSVFAGVALLALAARAFANVWAGRLNAPNSVDLNGIHLPAVAKWIQTQSIWGNHEFSPFFAAGNYTQNVDLTYLSTMLPLHQDVFARGSVLPFYALLGIAVYAFARELQAPRSTAALIATALLSTRIVGSTAVTYGLPDSQTLACLAGGAVFLARHYRTAARTDLVFAGLGLGIAFGGKWYGVACVAVLVFAWALVHAWRTRRAALVAVDTVHVSLWITLLGGVWLLRNWVTTGDPLFPLSVHLGGVSVFTAPSDPVRAAFGGRIIDYVDDHQILRHTLVPAWHKAFGTPGAAILVLGALAVVFWIVEARRGKSPSPAVAMALIGAALCAAIYTVTPYSALGPDGAPIGDVVFGNSRYVTPAIVLLTGPAAWALARFPAYARLAIEGLIAVIIVTAVRKSLVDVLVFPASTHTLQFGALLVVATAAALVARAVIPSGLHRPALLLAIALLGAGVAVVGRRAQHLEASVATRYATEPAIASLQLAPGKQTVGLAGYWSTAGIQMVYPAFGPRLNNRVSYIGHFVHGGLRPDDKGRFVKALQSGRYDILAIGSYAGPVEPAKPLVAWARSAGWKVAVKDPATTVMLPG